MKLHTSLLFAFSLAVVSCGGGKSNDSPVPANTVPPQMFGINMEWENFGYASIAGGELLRDRSFRMNQTTFVDMLGNPRAPLWQSYTATGGTVSFSATGGDTPPGEKSYDGYALISRDGDGSSVAKFTGVSQQLLDGIKSGDAFEFTFSSLGGGQTENLAMYLFDAANPAVPISNVANVSSGSSSWLRQTVTLTASADAQYPGLLVVLFQPNTDSSTRTVQLDELRLFKSGISPTVKTTVKNALADMGVKSVRWPGGTLVDFFDWKSSVGTNLARGEVRAASDFQTPAFGLHEFLNLCEETGMEPVIQVNFLNGVTEAQELVEYILGAATTPQGAIRMSNGRTAPWKVKYFEIGNEPSLAYKGSETPANTQLGYIALAKPVITAVKNKALSLGKNVKVSGIIDPSYQLADWFTASAAASYATNPDPKIAVVNALYYWNTAVLGSGGLGSVSDFLDGHFYGFREYDSAMNAQQTFELVMASGATLEKTMVDKIQPLSNTPLMLTEYHLFPEDKTTKAAQVQYLHDFQSGLGIADIVFAAIRLNAEGAHLYSFAHPYFGAVQSTDTGRLRPAGLALKMISPLAGGEKIDVSSSDAGTMTITTGSGNIPSGLSYPAVSAIAAKDVSTGKARILLLNRSFASAKTVTLTFSTGVSGDADIYTFENADIAANNESAVNVSILQTSGSFGSPFTVTIPAHSLMRIDMK